MRSRFSVVILFLALPFVLFMASEGEHHASGSMDFLGKVVNFVVLFGALAFLLYKPAKKFLGERGQAIDRSLWEAKDSREEAEKRLKESQRRLTELGHEITRMQEAAALSGRKEKERILREAEEEAEKLRRSTHLELEMLSKSGIKELKAYVLSLAAAQVTERIQRKLTASDQEGIIDKSIERLESLNE